MLHDSNEVEGNLAQMEVHQSLNERTTSQLFLASAATRPAETPGSGVFFLRALAAGPIVTSNSLSSQLSLSTLDFIPTPCLSSVSLFAT